MYIVNIAVRLLVLAFVLVGGAITFAGPESSAVRSAPTDTNKPADILRSSSENDAPDNHSDQNGMLPDMGDLG